MLDPYASRFTVPASVIEATGELLAGPGAKGFEASVVWLGRVLDAANAEVTAVRRPEQAAYATAAGLAVLLIENGLTELIASLGEGEVVLGRLHTHGNDDVAHSPVDDANLVVSHPGAVSIVVPRFAAEGIDVPSCGVHVLSERHRWFRLTPADVARRFVVR